MASGHRWWFGIPIAVTLPYVRAELPAGYIVSSAEDMSRFLTAQMNGGRYGNISVLSPAGIAAMHTPPAGGIYGMGWELVEADGRTLVSHDGGTENFQASLFFDPGARIGVFVAANVMNGLDAFASPAGTSPVDGPTVRAMAQSVLSLVADRPLPEQGPGHERLTLVFNLSVLALTGVLAFALLRARIRRPLLRPGAIALISFSVPAMIVALALDAGLESLRPVPARPRLVTLCRRRHPVFQGIAGVGKRPQRTRTAIKPAVRRAKASALRPP